MQFFYLFNWTISDGKPAGFVGNGTNETWARILASA